LVRQSSHQFLKEREDLIRERLQDREPDQVNALTEYMDKSFATLMSQFANIFGTQQTRRWLIPTAEVPLTNLVREQIVEEAAGRALLLRGGSPCQQQRGKRNERRHAKLVS
jgi:hypothetical protein